MPAADPGPALDSLPDGIRKTRDTVRAVKRDGQVTLRWDDTPVDLFFDYAPIHRDAAKDRKLVPFEGTEIPVLGPLELAAFKAMFNRTRDWADIEEMLAAGSLDAGQLHTAIAAMVGRADERHARIDEAVRRAGSP